MLKRRIAPLYCKNSHAEVRAITKALGRIKKDALKKYEIYIVRKVVAGHLTMAKPCKDCLALIKFVGLSKIYFTDWNGKVVKLNNIEENIEEEPP